MAQTSTPSDPPAPGRRKPFLPLVFVASVGGSYWLNFIWFYLQDRWGTDPVRNLLMNAGFGLIYTFGCWRTARVAATHSPRAVLQGAYIQLIAMTLVSSLLGSPALLAVVILMHGFVISRTWPNLEMLATTGRHGAELGRAISFYNIGWSLTSAVSYAAAGVLYKLNPWTLFIVPCVFWGGAIVLVRMWVSPYIRPEQAVAVPHEDEPAAPPPTDPALAESMRALSRTGDMACYILISVLIPIMPAIAARLGLDTAHATLFGSLWQGARVAAFLILGHWHGWHFKRGWFFGHMLALPALFGVVALWPNVWVASAAQVALGFSVGAVYTSALFYSMHGEAKTSEAAMHELVIGLGIMAGPLLSAACGKLGAWLGGSERVIIVASVIVVISGVIVVMLAQSRRAKGVHHRATENAKA